MQKRIKTLREQINNASMFDPINHLEAELFELELERDKIMEIEIAQAFGTYVESPPIVLADNMLREICRTEDCEGIPIFDHTTSEQYCEECGFSVYIGMHADNPGWTDTVTFFVAVKYKRVSHFIDHLLCLQGLESKTIPGKLIFDLKNELRDKTDITKKDILAALKKHKYKTYYINVNLIMSIICKYQLPNLPMDIYNKLIDMFSLIQKPFEDSKPRGRKNFLNYSYTIHKLLEIIGNTTDRDALDYICYFKLLKKEEVNREHEAIWFKICNITNFPFISSFEEPTTSV